MESGGKMIVKAMTNDNHNLNHNFNNDSETFSGFDNYSFTV